MVGFLLINAYALFVIVATTIAFFSKNRLGQVEDKTYEKFLIINIFMSLSGIVLGLVVTPDIVFDNRIMIFFNKIYLIMLALWIYTLTFYIVYISIKNKDKLKTGKKIFNICKYLSIFLIIALPIEVTIEQQNALATGPAVILAYAIFAIGFIIQIVCLLVNHKDFKNKKYIPLYSLILLGTLIFLAMIINPNLNYIINPTFIFIAFLMYHTIENPDKKILGEIHKAKVVSDNANEEKTMFLYNMTTEIRQISNNIETLSDELLDELDNKKIDIAILGDKTREIKGKIAEFNTITNEILDISQVDVNNIKIYQDKYNIKLIIKELVQIYKKKSQAKQITFRSMIASDIPEYLYGDSVSLKQVLSTILDNSVNYTTIGYVEFNINSIIKNDVCRLVITIEDSGKGMKISELNKIFNSKKEEKNDKYDLDSNLYNAKKIITLMGGTIIASSVYNQGTKMKIVLDQKIVKNESKIDKYEEDRKSVV